MVDTSKPSSTISAEHSQKKRESTVSWSLRSSCGSGADCRSSTRLWRYFESTILVVENFLNDNKN